MNKKPAPVILRNAQSETPSLWFYDEFGPDDFGMISAKLVRQTLNNLGPQKKLDIHFNTPGGDIFEASPIYNLIKNCGAKVTGYVDGVVASCGSWVVLACDRVVIAENALIMIHDPESFQYGNATQLRKLGDTLDQFKSAIMSCYSARSNKMTPDQFSAAMSAETWFTAQESVDAGLAEQIDPNKRVENVVDPRIFRNAPSWVKDRFSDDWKTAINLKRQQLLEAEAKIEE